MSASFVYLDIDNDLTTTNSSLSGLLPSGTVLNIDLTHKNKFLFGTEASNGITVGNTLIKEVDIISENLNISGNVEVIQNINVTDRLVSNILQVKDKLLDSNEAEGTIGKILVSTSTGKLEWGDLTTSTQLGTSADNSVSVGNLNETIDIQGSIINLRCNNKISNKSTISSGIAIQFQGQGQGVDNQNTNDVDVMTIYNTNDGTTPYLRIMDGSGYINTPSKTLTTDVNGKLLWADVLQSEEALATNDILLMGTSNVKGRTYNELKTDLSLNNVENTAISTWLGTTNITVIGTVPNLKLTGTLEANGSLGSSGQVLTTNGSSAYWAAVGSSIPMGSFENNAWGSGKYNFYIGTEGINNTSVGENNLCIGYRSGQNITGQHNLVVGNNNGKVGGGSHNVFIGQGGAGNTNSGFSVAIGSGCGVSAGWKCVSIGMQCGHGSSGEANTFIGFECGAFDPTSYNTFVGFECGRNNPGGGGYNTYIGYRAGVPNTTNNDGSGWGGMHNQICIGANTKPAGSYLIRIGNSAHTYWLATGSNYISDQRDKYDIQDTLFGLTFLNKLKVKDYKYDFREDYEEYTEDGIRLEPVYDGRFKKTRLHTGLIAQELKSTLQEIGIDHSMYSEMDYNDLKNNINGAKDICGIKYSELISVIIKSVQELSTENQQQQNEITTLKEENLQQQNEINTLKNELSQIKNILLSNNIN